MLPLVLSVAEQGVYQTVTLKVLAALQLNGTWLPSVGWQRDILFKK